MKQFYQTYKIFFLRLFVKVRFYGYEDILLRLFLDISANGDFTKLVISGTASLEECLDKWEQIIKRNSEENNSFQYLSYLSLWQGYNLLIAQHTTIKFLLLRASIKYDEATNEELAQRGFKLNISGSTVEEQSLNYAKSIEDCTRRSNAIVTKISIKKSEIAKYFEEAKSGKNSKAPSFEDIVSELELAIGDGRNIPDDITLARFNSLRKVTKRKQDILKQKSK